MGSPPLIIASCAAHFHWFVSVELVSAVFHLSLEERLAEAVTVAAKDRSCRECSQQLAFLFEHL